MKRQTIAQAAGVTVHVTLPEKLMKWAVRRARDEGHKDVSVVMRRGIDLLMARHKAGLPVA